MARVRGELREHVYAPRHDVTAIRNRIGRRGTMHVQPTPPHALFVSAQTPRESLRAQRELENEAMTVHAGRLVRTLARLGDRHRELLRIANGIIIGEQRQR